MSSPEPRDQILYDKIKTDITNKYKPSAYRSGLIVKTYKTEYYNKHNNNNAYFGPKPKLSNLRRWFDEEWRTDTGNIGYNKKDDIYRPTIRVNKDTPTTLSELTKDQIIRAKKEKATTGRVKRFDV